MSEKMKRKIAQKIMEKVNSVKDLEKVSVYEVSRELGISRTTFYRNFKDKYDVIDWIFNDQVFIPIEKRKSGESYAQRALFSLQVIEEHKVFFQSVMNFHGQNAFEQTYFNCISKDFQKRYRSLFPDEEESLFISRMEFYTAGIVRTVSQWLKNDCHPSPEMLTEHLVSIIENTSIT